MICRISFLLPDLARVIYLRDGRPVAPRTWMVPDYGSADTPLEGRDHLDESAWPECELSRTATTDSIVIASKAMKRRDRYRDPKAPRHPQPFVAKRGRLTAARAKAVLRTPASPWFSKRSPKLLLIDQLWVDNQRLAAKCGLRAFDPEGSRRGPARLWSSQFPIATALGARLALGRAMMHSPVAPNAVKPKFALLTSGWAALPQR